MCWPRCSPRQAPILTWFSTPCSTPPGPAAREKDGGCHCATCKGMVLEGRAGGDSKSRAVYLGLGWCRCGDGTSQAVFQGKREPISALTLMSLMSSTPIRQQRIHVSGSGTCCGMTRPVLQPSPARLEVTAGHLLPPEPVVFSWGERCPPNRIQGFSSLHC